MNKDKINKAIFNQWVKTSREAASLEDKLFIREKKEDEVEITQYLRPNARKRNLYAKVGEDIAKKAEELILSAELLPTGLIIIYARRKREGEEAEKSILATQDTATRRLIELINSFKEVRKNEKRFS